MTGSTRNLGVPLKNLKLKAGNLLAVIVRGSEIIIPEGSTSLSQGDSVIVVSRDKTIRDLNDIYADSLADGGGRL